MTTSCLRSSPMAAFGGTSTFETLLKATVLFTLQPLVVLGDTVWQSFGHLSGRPLVQPVSP